MQHLEFYHWSCWCILLELLPFLSQMLFPVSGLPDLTTSVGVLLMA